ncbi:Hypothetical protein, putative [Bodo saltans]|uniref:Uncharacterized protein n=1 Tax=Bodo saltans TaxID=75058 RepID=A0A0S4J3A9_BODSA|nr:Hypothetical protein, putative [Bodo saltans]|eukprot:CUG55236.1 Hypothetical protein, putative [Bodo saltans]
MTKNAMQLFLRAVQVTVVSPLEASGRRSISIHPEPVMNASAFNTSAFGTSGSIQEPTNSPARSPLLRDIAMPEMRIDEPADNDRKRASLGGSTSPQLKGFMAGRSPRGSISPVTNKLVLPRPRSSLSNAPEDEEDDTTLTVRWTLHDGKHLSQLTGTVVPKR